MAQGFPGNDPNVTRELRRHPVRTVAVIVLVNDERKILLIQTKRLPNQWQPIGGGVKESDRSIEAAAIREAREEFGLELQEHQLKKVCQAEYDFGEGTVYFFVAPLPHDSILHPDPTEIAASRWASVEEALDLPMFPATTKCLRFVHEHPAILEAALGSG
jgi:8-oxo-dGTP pyrophosphatase MutT (NUDIX family)